MKCFICRYLFNKTINIKECKEHEKYNNDKIRNDIYYYYKYCY